MSRVSAVWFGVVGVEGFSAWGLLFRAWGLGLRNLISL